MAEGEGAFMMQYCYLFRLVLRMKKWKFLFWILIIPAAFLNFLLFKDIEKSELGEVNSSGLTELNLTGAMSHQTLIPAHTKERTALMNVMLRRKANVKDWLQECTDVADCKAEFLKSVAARSQKKSSVVVFRSKLELICLAGGLAQILCPFLYHTMSQSLEYDKDPKNAFKDVTFAKYYDSAENNEKQDNTEKNGSKLASKPDSMCKRTALSFKFFGSFYLYYMGHMLVVTAAFVLYFTVGTLSSISNLKENGFLQLIFNNGFSAAAFWGVYWVMTIIEVVIISALTTIAYVSMCDGFFSETALMNTFLMTVASLLGIASVGFLIATVVPSFFFVLLIMILVQIILSVILVVAKIGVITQKIGMYNLIYLSLVIFPPAHIVEYGTKELLDMLPEQMLPDEEFKDAYKGYFDSLGSMIVTRPIILTIFFIYLDFIVKGGNGLCLPWGYPFNMNFWNPHKQKLIEMIDEQPKRANVEPTVGVPAVIANDIFMTYPSGCCEKKKPPVLKGVTCTVYQGQITALIGHNGAGKTTLIRVLMGEEIPTSGAAIINGHRVTDPYQRLALRGSVSICKQVDVLSNYLTVMESMKLTLVSKGFSVDSQVNKVLEMLKKLGLAGKEDVQAMDLSGGQMRKVCSIICLLGNPKLVILDEPTSGLDPVSRRNLWQILQDHKAGRSIILCTQFMDEADILADRKMFLSAGKLICAGSSLFLKHAFGCCVTINVSLKSESYANEVTKMLRKVKLVSQNQTELQLQVSADKPQILADAILALEQSPHLVDAFGVSQAQLDDIFMRLKDIDMNNIEASFKSKKLRKLGRGGSGKVIVDRVDFSAIYKSVDSSQPIKSTFKTQFTTLLRMNMSRQFKAKMTFVFRIVFPLVLFVGILALGFNAKKENDKEKTTEKKTPAQMADDETAGSMKPEALINLNSSKALKSLMFSGFMSRGFCIFDNETAPPINEMVKLCGQVFKTSPAMINVVTKKKKESVKHFLDKGGKKVIRKRCPAARDMVIYFCFYAYVSSWNMKDPNYKRSVYLGNFEVLSQPPVEGSLEQGIATSIMHYTQMATTFGSFEESEKRKLNQKSTTLALTLDKMKFDSAHELITFATAFALLPVTYLNDPIEDKDCGVRQHLASIGMSSLAYWFNTFVMHWLHYVVCFFIMSLACLVLETYQNSYFFLNVVFPVAIFGTTVSQLSVYVVSAMLRKTNAVVLVMYFFFALFLGIAGGFLQDKQTIMLSIICIVPQFPPVMLIIMSMKIAVYATLLFDTEDVGSIPRLGEAYASNDVIVSCLCAMPFHIIVLIGLIVIIENPGFLTNICAKKIDPSKSVAKPARDEGVKIEADRIRKVTRNSVNMLEVRDLKKVYPNGVHAVRGTTFGSICGEIIGLLGPNGAGKTTSMSIIVGEEASSSGTSEVHFSGTWMSGMEGALCGAIGYCPQHNPLFNAISVIDHLRFYASIRGIPEELATKQIDGLIDGLGLKPHQEKASSQLSGGNKRRLCLAIALLGNPSLVVIDEASTGVDPENKRFIWSAIRGMANKQRSVMITTHSMEEVEALCARVGIMNKGVMIAFGTVQQLRSRHGEAYTLDVMMKSKKPQKVALKKRKLVKRMAKKFKNCVLMEDLQQCMQFNIPTKSIPTFSGAMRWFIAKKKKLGIQFFSLYQMSLDQVFVKLVKEYDES